MSIKVITDPRVYLLGHQVVDYPALDEFLEAHDVPDWNTDATGGEELSEIAGRLCYMSFGKPRPGGNAAYLKHILEVGHGSVLEHAVYSFIITGVSRSFTHELVRHRAGFGYSQLSQRFVDESDVAFVLPPAMECYIDAAERVRDIENDNANCSLAALYDSMRPHDATDGELSARYHRWLGFCENALETYRDQAHCFESHHPVISKIEDKTTRRKAAREAARSVLPNCTETKIFVTANARALRHFIELRGHASADAEIRRVAVALLREVRVLSPNIFEEMIIAPCPLGGLMVSTEYHKV